MKPHDNNRISVAALRSLVAYEASTQRMTWLPRHHADERKTSAFNSQFAGKEAMVRVNAHGYRIGTVFGQKVQAHRAVWALHYGEWPEGEIDHINGDKLDNRIENLRVVTHHENCKNMARSKRNKSGRTGVRFNSQQGRWVAFIGKEHIGTFASEDAAIAARRDQEDRCGYHPNHGRAPMKGAA